MNDYAPLIERAFTLDLRESSYRVEKTEGRIPHFLCGTYYLNGPAKFERDNFRYRHWLDGDGCVCALKFDEDKVRFTNRFVRSAKRVAEEEAARPLFRAFGTAFEGDLLKRGIMLESPANVSVYPFAGRLLAFGEQGLPWELDPSTLETRGVFTFNGALNEISPFSAHPKLSQGEMINFGVAFSATAPQLHVYRFDSDAHLLLRKRIPMKFGCSVHDFSVSANYIIFYLSPYILRIDRMLEGGSLIDALSWEPERGSHLLILDRETCDVKARVSVGSRYALHTINSFEEEGRLHIDVIELERPVYDQYQTIPDLFEEVSAGRPVRFVIDPRNQELISATEIDYQLAPDFPSIDPRRAARSYRDCWMLGISAAGRRGRKFFDQLVHADWGEATVRSVYQAPPRCYLGGEPIFIAGGEGQGAVICQMFDAEREISSFVIFDPYDVGQGPAARIYLREPIHLGFHASFAQEA